MGHSLTGLALLIGIFTFYTGQKNAQKRDELSSKRQDLLDYKRKMWEMQHYSYSLICTAAGNLINKEAGDFEKASDEYLSLYYGHLLPVNDLKVKDSMKSLRIGIRNFREKRINEDQLKRMVIELGKECRESLRRNWQELDPWAAAKET